MCRCFVRWNRQATIELPIGENNAIGYTFGSNFIARLPRLTPKLLAIGAIRKLPPTTPRQPSL